MQGTRIDKDEPLFFIKVESLAAIENVGSRIKLKNHRPYTNIVTKLGSKEYSSIQMIDPSSYTGLGDLDIATDRPHSQRENYSISVFPNPISSNFELFVSSKLSQEANAELRVIQSANGSLVSSRSIILNPGDNVFIIDDLNNMPSGFYIYSLSIDGQDKLLSGKILKN